MGSVKVAVTIKRDTIAGIDGLVARKIFANRSQAIEAALAEKLVFMERRRLAAECAKLDPEFEQALADEGLCAVAESCPDC